MAAFRLFVRKKNGSKIYGWKIIRTSTEIVKKLIFALLQLRTLGSTLDDWQSSLPKAARPLDACTSCQWTSQDFKESELCLAKQKNHKDSPSDFSSPTKSMPKLQTHLKKAACGHKFSCAWSQQLDCWTVEVIICVDVKKSELGDQSFRLHDQFHSIFHNSAIFLTFAIFAFALFALVYELYDVFPSAVV